MEVGLYGKLPSHGDFLRRRVSDAFVSVWDEWLQQCIAASRSALGQNWLDVYLTSPVWRFACDTGVCGPRAYAGLMAPSVDRVGRYFPLTLVWEVPQGVHPLAVTQRADRWLDQVERLLLDAMAEEHVDLEKFDQRFVALSTPEGTDAQSIDVRTWQYDPLSTPSRNQTSGREFLTSHLLQGLLNQLGHLCDQ